MALSLVVAIPFSWPAVEEDVFGQRAGLLLRQLRDQACNISVPFDPAAEMPHDVTSSDCSVDVRRGFEDAINTAARSGCRKVTHWRSLKEFSKPKDIQANIAGNRQEDV